jgi:hypothetical protein
MDFKSEALEYVKIYFSVYPGTLPEDPKEAVKAIKEMHRLFKNQLIDKETKRTQDFFNH